jgi:thiol-disulfide isomerase/thioredoxin/outer membrane lipoprotein-sorting protein
MARFSTKTTLLCVAVMAPALTGITATHALSDDNIDARAMKVLEDFNAYVNTQEGYSTTISQSITMRSAFGNEDSESTYKLAVNKPNKLRLNPDDPESETIISDGNKLITNVPMLRGYVEADAPSGIGGVFNAIQSQSMVLGGGPLSFIAPMLSPRGFNGELATITHATYVGSEEVDGQAMHRVNFVMVPSLNDAARNQLRQQFGSDDMKFYVDAWIHDGDTPSLHKLHYDLAKMLAGVMAEMMEQMPQLREMTYDMVLTFDHWQTGDRIEADFSFDAPEDAIKAGSIDELIAANQPPSPDELLGKPAPDFEIAMLDGSTLELAQHKDRDVVILDFWATWCGPCIQAMPGLMEIADTYKDRNVVLYAVNVQEKPDTINNFLRSRDWSLNIPLDSDGELSKKFMVAGLPQTVVIGKDGTVQAVHLGYTPQLKQQLADELDKLIAGETLVN